MRRALPLLLTGILIAAIVAAQAARREAGIEVSVESIQTWVASLGWRGPVLYLGLVALRFLFFLPSWVVLCAGGLVFGVLFGTLLGGAGVLLSGLLGFSFARGIGRDWLRSRYGPRYDAYQSTVSRVGPLVVSVATAHPMGPMSAFHLASGLSTLSLVSFLLAVGVGGGVRAFLLSLFGASLIDPTSWEFVGATLLLAGAALSPLLYPPARRSIWNTLRSQPEQTR